MTDSNKVATPDIILWAHRLRNECVGLKEIALLKITAKRAVELANQMDAMAAKIESDRLALAEKQQEIDRLNNLVGNHHINAREQHDEIQRLRGLEKAVEEYHRVFGLGCLVCSECRSRCELEIYPDGECECCCHDISRASKGVTNE